MTRADLGQVAAFFLAARDAVKETQAETLLIVSSDHPYSFVCEAGKGKRCFRREVFVQQITGIADVAGADFGNRAAELLSHPPKFPQEVAP